MNGEKISGMSACRRGGCIFSLVKLAVLALIIVAVICYFGLSYIADYALKTITNGTGIDAGVSSVSISVTDQKFDVKNFYITNPPEYPKGNAIEFKNAFVDADIGLGDVLSKKLIKVEEVKIEGLKISYDMKTQSGLAKFVSSPDNNLNDIVNLLVGTQEKQEQEKQQAEEETPSEPYKIILGKLVFLDGDVKVRINIKLPSFTVENLDNNGEGMTPTQLTVEIMGKLAKQVTVEVAAELAKEGLQLGKDVGNDAANATEGAAKDLKKSVESALKDLFN